MLEMISEGLLAQSKRDDMQLITACVSSLCSNITINSTNNTKTTLSVVMPSLYVVACTNIMYKALAFIPGQGRDFYSMIT